MADPNASGLAASFLDGDLSAGELDALLRRLPGDAALRDAITTGQLVRDAVAGVRALDDGYTLRILARLREAGES
jgi:hypothetical protein